MPRYKVAYTETIDRIAIVFAGNNLEARYKVLSRQEDDNYENPAPISTREVWNVEPSPECDC